MKNKTRSEQRLEFLHKKGKEFSKDLIKRAGKFEKLVYRLLKDSHIPFEFQKYFICNKKYLYIVDFYLPEIGYFLEINGSQHYTKEGRHKDRIRKRRLKREGLQLLEIPNKQAALLTREDILKLYSNLLKVVKN